MTVNKLDELLVKELKDLYSMEEQIIEALPKIVEKASSSSLKTALQNHLEVTRQQLDRLVKIGQKLDHKLAGHTCKGMKGILEEGDELMKKLDKGELLDAALIGACQRVEHYEMAGYGTARAFARELGHSELAELLQKTLDEEGQADKELTRLAEQRINEKALR